MADSISFDLVFSYDIPSIGSDGISFEVAPVAGLCHRLWSDGCGQYLRDMPDDLDEWDGVILERLDNPLAGHHGWRVVDRSTDDKGLLPPVLAGPFRTLRAAKAASRLLVNTY